MKISNEAQKKVLRVLEICLELKQYGVDAFFYYYPHNNCIGIRVYLDGCTDDTFGPHIAKMATLKSTELTKNQHFELDLVLEAMEGILKNRNKIAYGL